MGRVLSGVGHDALGRLWPPLAQHRSNARAHWRETGGRDLMQERFEVDRVNTCVVCGMYGCVSE